MTNDLSTDEHRVSRAIGAALRQLREARSMSARQLAEVSGISAAMISRVERGHVSPSISTLSALSSALDVPLVSLFRETATEQVDYTHVRRGEGVKSKRIVDDHIHEFINLAIHSRQDLQFEARLVTLVRQDSRPPIYVGHGVVFVYVIEGEAVYEYGQREIRLEPGDSLSLDAELRYGFKQVLSPTLTFLTVQAEKRK